MPRPENGNEQKRVPRWCPSFRRKHMKHTAPVKLTAARAWRTYTGGSQIDKIHGIENSRDTQFPEEWIMSTVQARNPGRENIEEGICYLDGQNMSLKEYIETWPEETLGKDHLEKIGKTTGVLVKIIDAAERLTVQCHPNKEQALRLFNSQFGKTECWYILGGRDIDGEKPSLYFGFKEGIDRSRWEDAFYRQDIPAMLGMMHHFEVHPGDTFLIRGGVPHAIGAGCLLVEIQEPTDYTIRIERVTPKGLRINDMQCHQGLGFERMFECFDFTGYSQKDAFLNWKLPPRILEKSDDAVREELVGYQDTPCFCMERCVITGTYTFRASGSFFGIYVLAGKGMLTGEDVSMDICAGDQFFVPAACHDFSVNAEISVTLFLCRGPKI